MSYYDGVLLVRVDQRPSAWSPSKLLVCFYMAINLKTAASLGISLSDVFVARANEVRE